MPTTRTIIVYKFDELSEPAQEKALEKLWDINVNYDWWEHICEDAETIGVKITEFDLDSPNSWRPQIKGHLTENLLESFRLVRRNHGKDCETFKTAKDHLNKYIQAFIEWHGRESTHVAAPDWNRVTWLREFAYEYEGYEELAKDYLRSILEDYLIMLKKEYEYQTSGEQVTETIQANEYEFHEDGSLA